MAKKNKLTFFLNDQDGGEIVEYALVIGLLVVGIVTIVASIRTGASSKLNNIATELE